MTIWSYSMTPKQLNSYTIQLCKLGVDVLVPHHACARSWHRLTNAAISTALTLNLYISFTILLSSVSILCNPPQPSFSHTHTHTYIQPTYTHKQPAQTHGLHTNTPTVRERERYGNANRFVLWKHDCNITTTCRVYMYSTSPTRTTRLQHNHYLSCIHV